MPRIVGVDIPGQKRIETSLCYIYGIGPVKSREILEKTGIDPAKRAKDLTGEDIGKIAGVISKEYMVEGDLRRDVTQNIRRLISIGSYRGLRHRKGLPVHGQRTRTNARTRKGPKKTVGSKRKKVMVKPG